MVPELTEQDRVWLDETRELVELASSPAWTRLRVTLETFAASALADLKKSKGTPEEMHRLVIRWQDRQELAENLISAVESTVDARQKFLEEMTNDGDPAGS